MLASGQPDRETPGEQSQQRRELLLLVDAYPPMPRVFKLATHLPAANWLPVILAPRCRSSGDYRFAERGAPPSIPVVETSSLPALSALARRTMIRRFGVGGKTPADSFRTSSAHQSRVRAVMSRTARRVLLWTTTPDELVGWLPWALFHGFRLTRRRRIRAIVASGPPFSVVLAGAILKRLTGLPFVADFRDAWVQDPVDPIGCIGGVVRAPYGKRRIEIIARLEAYAISQADSVLFTSDHTLEAYRQAYPEVKTRGVVLYNGVEESDFVAPPNTSVPFAFTYVGSLHGFQTAQVGLFLRAFALAARSEKEFAASEVRIYGHRSGTLDTYISSLAHELGIEERVRRCGTVPHSMAVSLMKSRGVLLAFAGSSRFTRLSKISDYLAVQRPILALAAEDSETAHHVGRFGHWLYPGNSPEELGEIITRIWQTHRNDGPAPTGFPFPYPHPLNWRTTAFGLAAILDRLCTARAGDAAAEHSRLHDRQV